MSATPYEAPSVVSTVEPGAVYLGEALVWHVEVVHPLDDVVSLPEPASLAPFEVTGVQHRRESVAGDTRQVVDVWDLTGALYTLDVESLPTLRLPVQTGAGPAVLEIPGPGVTLKSLVAEEGQGAPRDLAPPESVMVPDYTLAWVAGGLLLALLTGWVAWRRWRRREKGVAPGSPPPPLRPLDQRTLEALQALRALIERGERRRLAFEASELVREYLGVRYGFEALERTTTELLDWLARRDAPGLDSQRLEAWVGAVDLIKYAGREPDAPECHALLDEAQDLVRETTMASRWAADQEGAA